MTSLDESPEEPLYYQCVLNLAKNDVSRKVIEQFYSVRDRVLIGKARLSFPVIPSQMLLRCYFWQLLTESPREEGKTLHLFTDHDINPNDVNFHLAWLKANGFGEMDLGGPVHRVNNEYLDFLLDRQSTERGAPAMNLQQKWESVRRRIAAQKQKEEERRNLADEEDQQRAIAIIEEYLNHPKTIAGKNLNMPVNGEISSSIRKYLSLQGFGVVQIQGKSLVCMKKPANKRTNSNEPPAKKARTVRL